MRFEKMFVVLALGAAACGSPDAADGAAARAERPTDGPPSADALVMGPAASAASEDASSVGQVADRETAAPGAAAAPDRVTEDVSAPEREASGEPAGAAADPGANEILNRAERAYASVRSMQADFVQRVTVPLLGQSQSSAGRIYHRRPDRFLMDFSDPEGDVIVADGRYLWMYYPSTDARQVMRTTLDAAGGSVDLQREFLSNATSRYEASHLGVEQVDGRPADVLRLVPREPSQYRQVKIWVDQRDSMVRRFEIVEQNESVRRLELRNLRPNVDLDDGLFTFTPPPGAQVFDS